MKKLLTVMRLLLMTAGLVCAGICAVQFVMALRFGELGRVLVYFVLAVLGLELFAISLTRLIRLRRNKESSVHS